MATDDTILPIEGALPALGDALESRNVAVLVAPPGAGKTTRVPLALLDASWRGGRKLVMLEPRRVAARAAASRMAETLGEALGATVGYSIRGERKVSGATQIEVVTEGLLTRRIQADPELSDTAALIFDEFHERSIHADLGLALARDVQTGLREDLRLLVMSATLDAVPVAALLGNAPMIRSEGRAYPVETRWLDAPWRKAGRARRGAFEQALAVLVCQAMDEEPGDALVFLPGVGEIERTRTLLLDRLPKGTDIRALHGSMPFAKQRAALQPGDGARRIVLATAIAQTALTIPGVRIVIDGGLARHARFDPGTGMTRLVTERVTKATATQRAGRAGRTEPGICYRLWTRGEEGGLAPHDRPEILDADLAPLALDLAQWGADEAQLAFLDPPPNAALTEARTLLQTLGALSEDGSPTAHGRALADLPLHPRLAHMVLGATDAGKMAALCAALLEERDPVTGAGADLRLRIEALQDSKRFKAERSGTLDDAALARIRDNARRIPSRGGDRIDAAELIALAYPDRIAARRKGDAPRYLLRNGKGAAFADAGDALAGEPFLAIAALDGDGTEARIRLAAPLTAATLEARFGEEITESAQCAWDSRTKTVIARQQRMLGAIALDDRPWRDAPAEARAQAVCDGIRSLGLDALPWSGEAASLRARLGWLRAQNAALPDWSDAALLGSLESWLMPFLDGISSKAEFGAIPLAKALRASLDWDIAERLDREAPATWLTPAGSRAPIDYTADPPALEVKLQALFGLDRHPTLGPNGIALSVRLLSPAGRPVQITGDLPGFWERSYPDVRKDLRGQYPKHPWPEDPLAAEPTTRAKPRKRS